MFKNRPMRTALTVLGVSLGIGAVVFLVSLGYGLQNTILNRITTADSLLSLDVTAGVSDSVVLNNDTLDKFTAVPGTDEISRSISFSASIIFNEITSDSVVYAVDPSFLRLSGIVPTIGKTFGESKGPEVIISSAAVKLFDFGLEEAVGKKINLTIFVLKINEEGFEEIETRDLESDYTIVGVVEDENVSFAYLPLTSINGLKIERYDQVKLKVTNSEMIDPVRDQITEMGFLASSLSDTIEQANKIFQVVQIVLFSFGFIALLVSAIGMFNTMTITLLERINEIGIMRSIGVTKKDIRRIFLLESMIMGFLGGVGGIIVGFLGGKLLNLGINILANNFGGQPVNLFYSPVWFVFIVAVFSTVVGFLTGVYPSMKAYRINPLDALRYK
jgi:putative ABC transport system permease protein